MAGQSPGTLEALARDFQALAWNESEEGSKWEWEPVRCRVEGSKLTVRTHDKAASFPVGFVVWGERHDPFAMASDITDDRGRLIVEFDKPEADASQVKAATAPREVVVEADEPAADEELTEEARELRGRKGFLLHPEARGEEMPTREVVLRTVVREQPARADGAEEEGGAAADPPEEEKRKRPGK